MLLETISNGWRRGRRTNTTDASFPSRLPTRTEPAGTGNAAAQTTSAVHNLANDGTRVLNRVKLMFYGAGSNNNTFSARLIVWRRLMEDGDLPSAVWIPTPLFEVQCTLSSTPIGVTGGVVVATDLFADTITITGTTANAADGIRVVSPANDTAGYVLVDFMGGAKIEPIFTTGSSATNCNCLLAML